MPASNRLLVCAIGGWLALSGGQLHAQQNNPQPEQAPAAQQPQPAQIAVPDSATIRKIFDEIKQILADRDRTAETQEKDKESREKADLIAQQAMADWAKLMVIVAGGQAVLGAITIGLLVWTGCETRKTARAAVAAAKESARSVRQAKRTADEAIRANQFTIHINRPWIAIEDFQITETLIHPAPSQAQDHWLWIMGSYKVINRGNTPAFFANTDIASKGMMFRQDDMLKLMAPLTKGTEDAKGTPLAPKAEMPKTFTTRVAIEKPPDGVSNTLFISVGIGVTYKAETITDIVRETTQVLLVFQKQDFGNTPVAVDFLTLKDNPAAVKFDYMRGRSTMT